jgi:hypothetical protein
VKPSNILVRPDGRFVLADFGLARFTAAGTLTRTGAQLGSPLYMSPEQLAGTAEDVDARADVYGLGATLYEALTGRPVFSADTILTLMDRVRRLRAAPPSRLVPGLPPGCDAVVLKAIEKRPDDRYATAAEFRDDLQALAEGRAPRGRPVSGTVLTARRLRARWRVLAAAAAVLVVALLWHANRPAVLELESFPRARVLVNGEDRGESPCRLELAPGTVELTLHHPRFRPTAVRLDLRPGERVRSLLCLVPESADDPVALRELALALGTKARLPEGLTRSPPAGAGPALALLPRGRVRAEDLRSLRFEVLEAERFPAGEGAFEFRRDGVVLHREPFAPSRRVTERPFPDAVRVALAPGDRLEWCYRAPGGEAFPAELEVVPEDAALEDRLRELDLGLARHPPEARAYLRGMVLLDHGLASAAIGEGRGLGGPAVDALVHAAALALGQGGSLLAAEARVRLASLPDALRAAWLTGG